MNIRSPYFVYTRPSANRASPTYAAAAKGRDMLKSHPTDGILLTLGELDESPSDHDFEAWLTQSKKDHYKLFAAKNPKARNYPPDIGTDEFRAAAALSFTDETGIAASAEDVVVSMGGKGVLNGLGSAMQPGDQVIVAAPGWPTNYDFWRDGVQIVEVDTNGRGLMTPEEVVAALAHYPNAKAVLINDPSNPTGARYNPEEREAVMAALRAARRSNPNLLAIVDDPYGGLTYGGATMRRGKEETALFAEGGEVVVHSVSKVYACPDLRVGWAISKNKPMLKAVQLFNQTSGCSVPTECQNKAQLLLRYGQAFKEATIARLGNRATLLAKMVSELFIHGDTPLSMAVPQGAIYGWIDCKQLQNRSYLHSSGKRVTIATPVDVAEFWRDAAHVAPVDGMPFYAPGSPAVEKNGWFVRVVLSDEAMLRKACQQLKQALSSLTQER